MTAEYIRSVFLKYGTDKAGPEHDYSEFYAQHLPEDPRKILEIGVKEGASIRVWKEIFPDAEIHGLDLFEEFPIPDIPGVTWHKGNQCDWRLLEELRKEGFDIVIDDGSHNGRDQFISFYGLCREGMMYFVEDLNCNLDVFYLQGMSTGCAMRSFIISGAYPFGGIYDIESENMGLILC